MASKFMMGSLPNNSMITNHPFYPLEVEIASYLANEMSMQVLLPLFFGGIALIVLFTRVLVNKVHPNLSGTDKAAIWWFTISGLIHLFFEGYFSLNHKQMGPAQDFFGQLWKEYALSDSRYLTSDAFVLCMETVTAFTWGPLCFFIAAFITTDHPLRHPIQIIVCVGQMYGLILYYATATFDFFYRNIEYSRPEVLYFWGYYFAVNFIWMVIPGLLLVSSVKTIAKKLAKLQQLESKANGVVNGKAQKNGHAKTS